MDLLLDKLLPLAVYPLGLTFVLSALAGLFGLFGLRRTARWIFAFTALWLWAAATPAFAHWLAARLESAYPPVAIADLPVSDVAILLGGALGQPLAPRLGPDLGDQADRILHTARLYHAGKARMILVAAGNLTWETIVAPEAVHIRDLLVELGVPASAIRLEGSSRNTHENAVEAGAMMLAAGWQSALLVTSAGHMPRAIAAFSAIGIDVVPASTDVRAAGPAVDSLLDFLPDASALAQTTAVFKEWLGLLAYRFRGWA